MPSLLDVARVAADGGASTSHWVEGDAEALPFGDASFDRVLSVFGVQFAPHHEVVAASSLRVCRPGGAIGLVNWTPDGPDRPALQDPRRLLAAAARGRLAAAAVGRRGARALAVPGLEVSFERGMNPFVFPSVDEYMEFFEERYGPTLKAKERLTADGRWERLPRRDARALRGDEHRRPTARCTSRASTSSA